MSLPIGEDPLEPHKHPAYLSQSLEPLPDQFPEELAISELQKRSVFVKTSELPCEKSLSGNKDLYRLDKFELERDGSCAFLNDSQIDKTSDYEKLYSTFYPPTVDIHNLTDIEVTAVEKHGSKFQVGSWKDIEFKRGQIHELKAGIEGKLEQATDFFVNSAIQEFEEEFQDYDYHVSENDYEELIGGTAKNIADLGGNLLSVAEELQVAKFELSGSLKGTSSRNSFKKFFHNGYVTASRTLFDYARMARLNSIHTNPFSAFRQVSHKINPAIQSAKSVGYNLATSGAQTANTASAFVKTQFQRASTNLKSIVNSAQTGVIRAFGKRAAEQCHDYDLDIHSKAFGAYSYNYVFHNNKPALLQVAKNKFQANRYVIEEQGVRASTMKLKEIQAVIGSHFNDVSQSYEVISQPPRYWTELQNGKKKYSYAAKRKRFAITAIAAIIISAVITTTGAAAATVTTIALHEEAKKARWYTENQNQILQASLKEKEEKYKSYRAGVEDFYEKSQTAFEYLRALQNFQQEMEPFWVESLEGAYKDIRDLKIENAKIYRQIQSIKGSTNILEEQYQETLEESSIRSRRSVPHYDFFAIDDSSKLSPQTEEILDSVNDLYRDLSNVVRSVETMNRLKKQTVKLSKVLQWQKNRKIYLQNQLQQADIELQQRKLDFATKLKKVNSEKPLESSATILNASFVMLIVFLPFLL